MTALRSCPVPGCPNLTAGGRCHRHARTRRGRERRPDATRRGYDGRWRKSRAAFLADHPWCHRCGARATDVHHLDGLGPLGPLGHDPTNFEALCHSCHSRETYMATKRKFGGKKAAPFRKNGKPRKPGTARPKAKPKPKR
jgi:5-methylcytosine-specific restriction protein A